MKYSQVDWSRYDDKPEEGTYDIWHKARKEKHKVSVNQISINRMAAHINKLLQAGVSADEAFSVAADEGWRGIKYQWVMNAIARDMDGLSDNFQVSQQGRRTQDLSIEHQLNDRSWAD
jgi:hypothetical protein